MSLPVLSSVIRHIVLLGFIAQEFVILDGSVAEVVAAVVIIITVAAAAVVGVVVVTTVAVLLVERDPITKIDDIIF